MSTKKTPPRPTYKAGDEVKHKVSLAAAIVLYSSVQCTAPGHSAPASGGLEALLGRPRQCECDRPDCQPVEFVTVSTDFGQMHTVTADCLFDEKDGA